MPIISKDYESFLKGEKSVLKLNFYERLCSIANKFFPRFLMYNGLEPNYNDAIEFSHLKITPKGAFAFSIFVSILTFLGTFAFLGLLDSLSMSTIVFCLILGGLAFYFTVNYPMHYATIFRINASSEMILAVIYMGISMRLSPNLENAVRFASENLKGSLSIDLRELLWGVYTRRYDKIEDAIDAFSKKWERDNKEFTSALYLIKNSSAESEARREKFLDEAVSVVLDGTKDRMKSYARELKEPVVILNALGILLPIIGLVFFPIVSLFLPDVIKPTFLIVVYNIFLPIIVYLMMTSYLEKRPYSLRQPDLSKHPDFQISKLYEKPYTIPVLVSLPLLIYTIPKLFQTTQLFDTNLLIYSLLAIAAVFSGIISYSYLSVKRKLKIRQTIADIEGEYAEALFQLGSLILRGMPLETALRRTKESIKSMKIENFFDRILYNIETFGMTLENAVFDKQYGAINYYPSTIIKVTMGVIVETSKKGMVSASKAMLIISKYLKDMRDVNEDLQNMMEEVTSTMNIQALILAPISAGVVVTIYSVMARLSIALNQLLGSVQTSLSSSLGTVGNFGSSAFGVLVNLSSIIPVHDFQMIVGVYLIEIVALIAASLSTITNGDETLLKRLSIAKMLGFGAIVYFVTLIFTYVLFNTVIDLNKIVAAAS